MASEFESNARWETVQAVERRWKRQHDAERRQRLRKRFGNLLAIVVLLAGLMGIGCFAVRYFEMNIPFGANFDMRNLLPRLNDVGQQRASTVEVERRNEYARLLESFKGKACVLWRDAPKEIRPKTAVTGVRYLILCGDKNDMCLYELFADGRGSMTATALSPIAAPMGVSIREFRKAVAGRPFFILCNDVIYIAGCKDEEAAKRHLQLLL